METLRIDRLETRLRVRGGAGSGAARARLDGLVRDLPASLELALERAGVPAHEEICIQTLHVPARVRLSHTDADVCTSWSVAFAAAVRRALEVGAAPGVVRYGSRHHALVDLAASVAAGSVERAWAWRQLGLWRPEGAVGGRAAVAELVRALGDAPEAVVAVLSELARRGVLPRLAARLEPADWAALARAGLSAAGAAAVAALPRASGDAIGADLRLRAERLVRGSALAAAAPSRAGSPAERAGAGRARALLVVLEVEPAALRAAGASVVALVRAVEEVLHAQDEAAAPPAPPAPDAHAPASRRGPSRPGAVRPRRGAKDAEARPAGEGEAAAAQRPARPLAPERAAPEPDGAPFADASETPAATRRERAERRARDDAARGPLDRGAALPALPDAVDAAGARASGDGDDAHAPAAAPQGDDAAAPDAPSEPRAEAPSARARAPRPPGAPRPAEQPASVEAPFPLVRQRAFTRAGGLLFLLHVVGELGLPDEIVAHPLLGARPFRWTMHQLARALAGAPLEPSDPAALAFAGLGPNADPTFGGEEPPGDAERAALALLATRVVGRLRARVSRPAEPDAALLLWLCRRRAEVLADPGWIELRFSLDDVSTEIRRAQLDLDPGWIAWLGVVVRFTYA